MFTCCIIVAACSAPPVNVQSHSEGGVVKAVAVAAAAAAGAHAFVSVAQLQGGIACSTSPGNVAGPGRGGFGAWARQIAIACAWAALIAFGQLIYVKFTRHWEGAGFPTLPTLSLKAADGKPPQLNLNLPGTSSSASASPAPGTPGVKRGFLDEYLD